MKFKEGSEIDGYPLDRFQNRGHQVEDKTRAIMELVSPSTFLGKLRMTAVERFPFLEERLFQSPMEVLSAGLRDSVLSLHQDIELILRDGATRVRSHNELTELLAQVVGSPEDMESVRQLRNKLRAKAEADLGIRPDSEVNEIIREIEGISAEEKQKQEREKYVEEAQRRIATTQPIIDTLQTVLVAANRSFDNAMANYSYVLDLKHEVRTLSRTSRDLARSTQLGLGVFPTTLAELNKALQAAEVAIEAIALQKKLEQTQNLEDLGEVQRRASSLLLSSQGINKPNETPNQLN